MFRGITILGTRMVEGGRHFGSSLSGSILILHRAHFGIGSSSRPITLAKHCGQQNSTILAWSASLIGPWHSAMPFVAGGFRVMSTEAMCGVHSRMWSGSARRDSAVPVRRPSGDRRIVA